MSKTRKILAMVLATVMAMSLFVCPSFAAGKLEIKYWNADSTKITLEFSEEVDISNLENAITLTLDNEEVDFIVEKRIPTVTSTLGEEYTNPFTTAPSNWYREPLAVDTDVTYEIYPEGGMQFDKIYFLTVAGGLIGKDGGILTGGNWEKGIKVVKLWKEDFNSYASTDAMPWIKNAGTLALADKGDGDKYVSWTVGGGVSMMAPAVFTSGNHPLNVPSGSTLQNLNFADTGMKSADFWKDGSAARAENQYNIEMDFKIDIPPASGAGQALHGIIISMSNTGHRQPIYGGSSIAAGTGCFNAVPISYGLGNASTEDQANVERAYRMASGTANIIGYKYNEVYGFQTNGHPFATTDKKAPIYQDQWYAGAKYADSIEYSVLASSTLDDGNLANDVNNKLVMSVKDSNIKFSVDSASKSGFTSYDYTNTPVSTAVASLGYPVFSVHGDYSTDNVIYHFDNILATKAIGYTLSSFEMTPADEEVEVPIGDTITLTFLDDVDADTVSADTIKVYADDVLLTDYTLTVNQTNPKLVDIKLAEEFDYRTTYKVVPDGVYLDGDDTLYYFGGASFVSLIADTELSTLEADISYEADPEDPEKQIWSAGTYTVNAVFENNKIANGATGVITICLYDENMKMVDVAVKAIDVALGGYDSLSDTWTITEAGAYTAKCYVWDGFSNMNMILEGDIQ